MDANDYSNDDNDDDDNDDDRDDDDDNAICDDIDSQGVARKDDLEVRREPGVPQSLQGGQLRRGERGGLQEGRPDGLPEGEGGFPVDALKPL